MAPSIVPAGGSPKFPSPVNVPLREVTTQNQVNTLLGILGMSITALGFSIRDQDDLESSVPQENRRLPGEALVAAENTFINVLERLDAIVKDERRWSSSFQDKIEADYQAAYAENIAYLEAQKKAAQELASPHQQLRPDLVRLQDGSWCCLKGDPKSPGSIIGVGPSPELAVQAFDDAFRGVISPYTQAWLDKHGVEAEESQNEKPQQKPRKKRSRNEPPNLETGGGEDNPT
jgi:hypothetical protein